MARPAVTPHVLLVEGSDPAVWVALRFRSVDAARAWEDKHPLAEVHGCLPLVSQAEAILDYGVQV